ncbi:zinc finger protein 84-like [Phlebotomus argentipes]|uniref:zinc finger protein 84-like n=1 Tax=Phlebotomus argentipes TaxID=94469 RepID=UPI0028932A9C|nr:zinc finger protein 84-like [Phlebotomus argentipes]
MKGKITSKSNDESLKTCRERSTPEQLKYLFQFMTTNVNLIEGRKNQSNSRTFWKKLSQELNNLGPPKRSIAEWKKIWASNKFKLKKKLSVEHTSNRMRSFGCSINSLDTQIKGAFVQKSSHDKTQSGHVINGKVRHFCRICLQYSTVMKTLESSLMNMYAVLIGKPLESHGITLICEQCSAELARAYKFRLLCLETEEKILNLKSTDAPKPQLTDSAAHQLCSLCGKMLKAESMKAHVKRHEADQEDPALRPFVCSDCGRSYRTLCNLQSHMSYTHTKTKAFKCRHCDVIFSSYFRRRLHETTCRLQQQTPAFACPICQHGFHHPSKRDDHVRTRHTYERPFQCSDCEKSFFTKSVLRRHVRIHAKEHRVSCSICSCRLRSWRSLAAHMTKNHSDQGIPPPRLQLCQEAISEPSSGRTLDSGEDKINHLS